MEAPQTRQACGHVAIGVAARRNPFGGVGNEATAMGEDDAQVGIALKATLARQVDRRAGCVEQEIGGVGRNAGDGWAWRG
jgi:hypothetical protein